MLATTITTAVLAALLSAVAAQNVTTGKLGDALVVTNNPSGPVYVAALPVTEFFHPNNPRGNVKGLVAATANPGGVGVSFSVSFSNLPTEGGPFLYHIHDQPVPANGNCTQTLAHLDPFIRGETPACDATQPQTCQVGDLAGKHGKITSDPFIATYTDDYASTVQGIGAFFGNRSIVVHFANTTRITCANFALAPGITLPTVGTGSTCGANSSTGTGSGSGSGTGTGTSTGAGSASPSGTVTSTPAAFTGAASKGTVSLISLVGAVGFAFLML